MKLTKMEVLNIEVGLNWKELQFSLISVIQSILFKFINAFKHSFKIINVLFNLIFFLLY